MAFASGFFNARVDDEGNYDREYFAEDFAKYFASFIGNGVFPNPSTGMQVMAGAGGGLNVVLRAGQAWINGYWCANTTDMTIALEPASGTMGRIDAITLRWSAEGREITPVVKQGILSALPQKPLPQRDADAYELIVAYVYVNRNIIAISQTNIEDTRPIPALCGWVHGVVDQIDTTTLGNQLQTFIDEYMAKYNAKYNDFLQFIENLKTLCQKEYDEFVVFISNLRVSSQSTHDGYEDYIATLRNDSYTAYIGFIDWLNNYKVSAQADFEAWVETLKGILNQEVAGNLYNEIDALKALNPSVILGTITHSLNKYAVCTLYDTTWAGGIAGAGNGPAGGENLTKINGGFVLSELDKITVSAPEKFSKCTEIIKIDDHKFAFISTDSQIDFTSLLLTLD